MMPTPVVNDLRKATSAELREEVITLRLFVANMLMGFKEQAIQLNSVDVQFATFRADIQSRVTRIETQLQPNEVPLVSSLSRMDELAKEEYEPFGPSQVE